MLEMFFPDEDYPSSYQIPYESYYEAGYRGIIFDIDNTLVPHGAPATEEAIAFFARLRKLGFSTCLLSNNREMRVEPFARAVGSAYVFKAGKPGRAGYEKAMNLMHTTKDTTLFVGDQLFTDVWGARRCRIHSLLVKPIDKKEEIQIVLKRYLERLLLIFYEKQKKG